MYIFQRKNIIIIVKFILHVYFALSVNKDLMPINFGTSSWYYRTKYQSPSLKYRHSNGEKREENTALRRYLRRSLRIKDTVIILTSHR